MTEERWARLFLPALRLDRQTLHQIRQSADLALDIGVGGFIVFGGEAAEVAEFTRYLRVAAGRPLWLAADLERGAGQQFSGASRLPPPRALAAHVDPVAAVQQAGRLTGAEARRLGINWVLGPVLDLDNERRNPIVGTRSFGPEPARVAELGGLWTEACMEERVATCAKHFPGHGRTVADSHMELPVVDADRHQLERDLEPFRAVAATVPAVMLAHVAYPGLGSQDAATVSPEIATRLLREEIGFAGLAVTDALIMSGFHGDAEGEGQGTGGSGEGARCVAAVRAGCDLLLYPRDLDACVRSVAEEAAVDERFANRCREAIAQSESLAARFDSAPEEGGVARLRSAGELTEAAKLGEQSAGRRLDLAIGCLSPSPDAPGREWSRAEPTELQIIVDDPAPGSGDPFGQAFTATLRERGWQLMEPGRAGNRPTQRLLLIQSTPRGWKGRATLTDDALARVRDACGTPRSAALVFGHRRILDDLGIPGLCAWSDEPLMQRAAAHWLDARAS